VSRLPRCQGFENGDLTAGDLVLQNPAAVRRVFVFVRDWMFRARSRPGGGGFRQIGLIEPAGSKYRLHARAIDAAMVALDLGPTRIRLPAFAHLA
jgi:hypothetical protein